ncbi:MAG: hypothetical protein ABIO31_12740 [Candidatus Nitrotoga sp.]
MQLFYAVLQDIPCCAQGAKLNGICDLLGYSLESRAVAALLLQAIQFTGFAFDYCFVCWCGIGVLVFLQHLRGGKFHSVELALTIDAGA